MKTLDNKIQHGFFGTGNISKYSSNEQIQEIETLTSSKRYQNL